MDVITLETNHLKQGDQNPSKQDGIMRLYSMKYCPFAERARLVLLVKNLRHEIVNIDLKRKPDWFLKLNPKGLVPTLDDGSKIITESLDVCDYLDDVYPEPRLKPSNPEAKMRDKSLLEKYDKVIPYYYKILRDTENKPLSEYVKDLLPLLEEFENELRTRGDYFGGSKPGMVDYMIWPWAERVEVIDLARGEKLQIPEDKISLIRGWCSRMKQLDVVKNTIISTDRSYKLFKMYESGDTVEYDAV